jgi:hypothetical protein
MLRDQFRRWGINDKNVRKNPQRGNLHAYAGTQFDHGHDAITGPHDPLHLPTETRSLYQALHGLQHWSNGSRDMEGDNTDIVSNAVKFHDYLWDMKNAIRILEAQRMGSSASVGRLSQAGNRLTKCFGSACTPLAVLLSMQVIIELKLNTRKQDSLPWSEATSTFLLQVTANNFVRSHPVSMLVYLLTFGKRTSDELAAIYEAGCSFVSRHCDRFLVLRFRTSFFQTMLSLGLDASFESDIEALVVEASDQNEILDGRVLCDLAGLRLRQFRFEAAVQLARACLMAVQIHNDSRWIARQVLRALASAQSAMNDYGGAETSLLHALRLTTNRELDDTSAPLVLSSSSMMVVDDLRQLYRLVGEEAKYRALCLSYNQVRNTCESPRKKEGPASPLCIGFLIQTGGASLSSLLSPQTTSSSLPH